VTALFLKTLRAGEPVVKAVVTSTDCTC
jgi:hypothetical protein